MLKLLTSQIENQQLVLFFSLFYDYIGDMYNNKNFILERIANLTSVNNDLFNMAYLLSKAYSYISLHKELFGDYDGDLMRQPSEDVMQRTSGSFYEFLEREGLLALVPVMEVSVTVMGYGRLDELGALYGLQWNTPKVIAAMVAHLNQVGGVEANINIMKQGFEILWRKIVDKEKLAIRYNSEVNSIVRGSGDNVRLTLQTSSGAKTETCSFLIWAANARDFVNKAKDATEMETELFASKKGTISTVSLVNYATQAKYDHDCYNLDNINKEDHSVLVHTSTDGSLVLGNCINRFAICPFHLRVAFLHYYRKMADFVNIW